MQKYDYIIIGSGPAAYRATNKLRATQRKVLVIEKGKFGGTCPNDGCEPKIFLDGAVQAVLKSQSLLGKGLKKAPTIDWSELITRKKRIFESYPALAETAMSTSNIDTVHGEASFVGSHVVEVNNERYTGGHILIATGQHANKLPIIGSELLATSYDFFQLDQLPKQLIIIGAGYVGMELATLASAAGAKVEIVEYGKQALPPFDQSLVKKVIEAMTSRGIKFHFNQNVTLIKKTSDSDYQVNTEHGLSLHANYVLDATGRHPTLSGLNLDAANIQYDDRGGIQINDYLETSVPGVYALGDVANKKAPKLTTVAWYEASYLIDSIENQLQDPINYPATGTVAFTFPQIAQVGINPDKADKDSALHTKTMKLSNNFDSLGQNDAEATLNIIYDENDTIVGAAEVSQQAADDINQFASLIGFKLTNEMLEKDVIFAFPTLASKLDSLLW